MFIPYRIFPGIWRTSRVPQQEIPHLTPHQELSNSMDHAHLTGTHTSLTAPFSILLLIPESSRLMQNLRTGFYSNILLLLIVITHTHSNHTHSTLTHTMIRGCECVMQDTTACLYSLDPKTLLSWVCDVSVEHQKPSSSVCVCVC